MKGNKTYFIKTFGCQMNEADSERIAGMLEAVGLKPAKKVEESDWVIINTCSVRQSAEDRVYGLVKNLKKLKIILTGCMLYHSIADLRKKLPEIDYFIKTSDLPKFLSQFLNFSISAKRNQAPLISKFLKIQPKRDDKVHAWVPIMEGCSHYCTYCVVPYARGKEQSRDFEEIISEVENLIFHGYKEITLLGQNVNSYGLDWGGKPDKKPATTEVLNADIRRWTEDTESWFARLLKRLNEIPGIEKISFITSNPWDLTDDIIEAMRLPKIDRYLHLAVQSGDDKILKKMNRPYTLDQYLRLVKKIRKRIPDIKIGTDIIVGFPGEAKEAFENTVKFCKKTGFEKAYIAIYSPRPGTAAYRLKDNISHKEKKRRWKILEELVNKN